MEDESPRSSRSILVIAGIAIAIGLGALIFVLTRGASPTPMAKSAMAAPASARSAANPYTITSTDPAVKVALLSDLPKSPGSPAADADCNDRFASPPKSAGAKLAAGKGWLIGGEGRLGPLSAVVITSGFVSNWLGCLPEHGNIALFDGDRLVAILYIKGALEDQIGAVETVGDAAWVRRGGPVAPLAKLTISGRAIRLGPLPAVESVCGGRRKVPNIFGLPIEEARRKLMAAGWRPVPAKASQDDSDNVAELRKQGIVEADYCLPTGYGQCGFNYAEGQDQLSVSSTEQITGYSADCGS